ncbi:MAG: hypothetical protein A3F84_28145 [Candidatus Handelsmanbacteria bacterium RIFCSPLOWO2_12_FULL_64_10]|uniref:PDZ domain-containing protein n=1 Tax=Handelsmanbacteria sp. (strain RIFCSPLOWO2_12_FULL_64_10) TaxID=1817868 RepID=A0A1F6CI41_HANXR|nr:MAG: hypothetical protein A3F84_28145 [Candidatus Handelsmanbacteria bacterium RIFCSPLOWO2_12_FULL_64_10]
MTLLLLAALAQEDDLEAKFTRSLGKVAAAVAEASAPSVVAIEVDRDPRSDGDGFNPNQGAAPDYYRRPEGLVSGAIVGADGWILTSYFNVSGEIRGIKVRQDSKTWPAKLVGYDKPKDIALLKIEAEGLPVLRTAVMEEIKTGRTVFVMGRSPDASRATITDGIVSAVHRFKESAIQVDAEMNFGSTGGPCLDAQGRLVGIAAHINPKSSWGQSGGVGFVTRIDAIEGVLEKLKKGEKIEKAKTPWIGILGADSEDPEGVRVQEVLSGSPAEAAKLEADDVIVEVDGKKVATLAELQQTVQGRKVDQDVTLTIVRKGKEQKVKVTLGENPNE